MVKKMVYESNAFVEKLIEQRKRESDRPAFDAAVRDYFEGMKTTDLTAHLAERESDASRYRFLSQSRIDAYRKAVGLCRELGTKYASADITSVEKLYAEMTGAHTKAPEVSLDTMSRIFLSGNNDGRIVVEPPKKKIGFDFNVGDKNGKS